jgi:hypothetical protein
MVDAPWPGHVNHVFVRVHNEGTAAAHDLRVDVAAVPLGPTCGTGGQVGSFTIPSLAPRQSAVRMLDWTPQNDTPVALHVDVHGGRGAVDAVAGSGALAALQSCGLSPVVTSRPGDSAVAVLWATGSGPNADVRRGRRAVLPPLGAHLEPIASVEALGAGGQPAQLSLTCPKTAAPGDTVHVTGSLTPVRGGVPVAFDLGGDVTVVETSTGGAFSTDIKAGAAGTLTVGASFQGTAGLQDADASPCSIAVVQAPVQATLSLTCTGGGPNTPFTVSGSLAPAVSGASVSLTYRGPQGETSARTAMTNASGAFSDRTVTPDLPGRWTVSASGAAATASCTVTV